MMKKTHIGVVALVIAPMLNVSPTRSNPLHARNCGRGAQAQNVFPDSMIWASNPSDAPLGSLYCTGDVFVRVDCKTYVSRYEMPFNHLTSAFIRDQPIQVRLTVHVMYFDLPNDLDTRMGIVRCSSECGPKRYLELSGSKGFAEESTR